MKKAIIIALFLAVLTGCENRPEETNMENIRTSCLNGVTYYHYAENKGSGYKGYGYMAPAYNTDGSLILCKENYSMKGNN